jgi:hypothetical protein
LRYDLWDVVQAKDCVLWDCGVLFLQVWQVR